MKFLKNNIIEKEELYTLYKSNNWVNYINNFDNLILAYKNSNYICAYNDNKLIAVIRYITDEYTILYIQDILVLPQYHRLGIGTKLLKIVLEEYKDIYQCVLITDNTVKTRNYYEKIGFKNLYDLDIIGYLKMYHK